MVIHLNKDSDKINGLFNFVDEVIEKSPESHSELAYLARYDNVVRLTYHPNYGLNDILEQPVHFLDFSAKHPYTQKSISLTCYVHGGNKFSYLSPECMSSEDIIMRDAQGNISQVKDLCQPPEIVTQILPESVKRVFERAYDALYTSDLVLEDVSMSPDAFAKAVLPLVGGFERQERKKNFRVITSNNDSPSNEPKL